MFRHRLNLNPYFALLVFLIIPFVGQVHWLLFYFSFFLIYGIGIGLGYHRVLCHQVKVPWVLEKISVYLGLLSHAGSLKGSILWHINHHIHADTEYDTQKDYSNALKPRVENLRVKLSQLRKPLNGIEKSFLFQKMEKYYYLVFAISYLVFGLSFGVANLIIYMVVPGALALIVHSYSAVYIHRHGYRNFTTQDKSHNAVYLLPIMFGENWHNNHHQHPRRLNQGVKWWEFDFIFLFSYLFIAPSLLFRKLTRDKA